MTKINFPNVQRIKTRHGKFIYYYQEGRGYAFQGPRIRLPNDPTSTEFTEKYNELSGNKSYIDGSFKHLTKEWMESPEFLVNIKQGSQEWYANYIRQINETWGNLQVNKIKPKNILTLQKKHSDRPYTANGFIKTLSVLFRWGIPMEFCDTNPAEHIKLLRTDGDGYPPWHDEDIELFKKHVPPQLYLAVQLGLYTGQRSGDVRNIRWSDIENGRFIKVSQEKTGKTVWVSIHPELNSILNSIKKVSPFVLNNTKDMPYQKQALKSAMRRALNKVDLKPLKDKKLVFHGLPKSATEKLYEAGCNNQEISAITGMSDEIIKHYLKHFEMKKLSEKAMRRWEESETNIEQYVKPL